MIRTRAIAYNMHQGYRTVYFDAIKDCNSKEINGYKSKKHRTKVTKTSLKDVTEYHACSGLRDTQGQLIYQGDQITFNREVGEIEPLTLTVIYNQGAFYVDEQKNKEGFTATLLYNVVKNFKCTVTTPNFKDQQS